MTVSVWTRFKWALRNLWRSLRCPMHEISEEHWATADLNIIDLWCVHCGARLESRRLEDLPEPMRTEVARIVENANWS